MVHTVCDGQKKCAVRICHVSDISICSFHFDCPRYRAGKLSLGSLDPFTLQLFEVPMGTERGETCETGGTSVEHSAELCI